MPTNLLSSQKNKYHVSANLFLSQKINTTPLARNINAARKIMQPWPTGAKNSSLISARKGGK